MPKEHEGVVYTCIIIIIYYAKLFPEKLWLTKSQYRTFVAHLERGVEEDGLQLS